MIIKANTRFVFHSVGEGLFYTGQIRFDNNQQFNFVYDCGGKYVHREIKRYKHDMDTKDIDMLVISHFHYDHVSGLNNLLSKFNVKKVFIPYYNFIERLYLAVTSNNIPDNIQWYFSFIVNPIKYLLEGGVEDIIIILGSEKFDENTPNDENIPPAPEKFDKINFIIKLAEAKRKILDNENLNESEKNKVKVCNHKGNVFLNDLWLFKFYNNYISDKNFKNLIEELKECMKQSLNICDANEIKEIIKNKENLKKIKDCYKEFMNKGKLKNLNNTSLILMHIPINLKFFNFKFYNGMFCFPFCCCIDDLNNFIHFIHPWYHHCWELWEDCCLRFSRICRNRFYERIKRLKDFVYGLEEVRKNYKRFSFFGQALTGDIDLNFKYQAFLNHFSFFKDKLITLQLPHHGSRYNWNKNFINDFFLFITIASAGINNRYGHPSKFLFDELSMNCIVPIWINEIRWQTLNLECRWQ